MGGSVDFQLDMHIIILHFLRFLYILLFPRFWTHASPHDQYHGLLDHLNSVPLDGPLFYVISSWWTLVLPISSSCLLINTQKTTIRRLGQVSQGYLGEGNRLVKTRHGRQSRQESRQRSQVFGTKATLPLE